MILSRLLERARREVRWRWLRYWVRWHRWRGPPDHPRHVPTLPVSDQERRDLLDSELPEVCRVCETGKERLRLPGQFLCETCALDHWGLEDLEEVLRKIVDIQELEAPQCDYCDNVAQCSETSLVGEPGKHCRSCCWLK